MDVEPKLLDQVGAFGFTPPRAKKSRRMEGALYQFTVSRGVTTEIKDVGVERIRQAAPAPFLTASSDP